ncbi:MAG TPA: AraC family transcriptional regulator [Ensifer sp.]|jgi:AraC-like DNA-binding protein|uniref:AraC family transcriptional regulator n=1 Tax=Ensifer sp. TaxID=1872086 RepID=UPI002E10153C|nr:AraC family transcriptional regulator [Ensifer sp.]
MTAISISARQGVPEDALSEDAALDLERLCGAPGDGIRVAPAIEGIERIEARLHGKFFEPHRHDTYAIGVTLGGVQTFQYRGESRFSNPGSIIIIHPDEVHDGGAGTDIGLRYRMMYLQPERLLAALDTAGGSLPFVAAPVVGDEALRQAIGEAVIDLDHGIDELALDDILARIAEGLCRHAGAGEIRSGKTDKIAVLRATDFLRANLDSPVGSPELEAISGLDRFTLARQFRKVLGTSPHRYLLMRRLERARQMIAKGESLAGAALETGFADQAHFTRHFKRAYGLTPGRWANLAVAG